jgi:hypothetical protein
MDNNRHGLGIELEVGFDAMEKSYDEIWKANDDQYSTQDELSKNQKWMFSMLEDIHEIWCHYSWFCIKSRTKNMSNFDLTKNRMMQIWEC